MSDFPIKSPRKLIEVALPLNAINTACAREKTVKHGHPASLHLWWARRPLAAARAVIFGQLVNDPGYQQVGGFKYGKNKKDAAVERKRLFKIIEDLVLWENTTNEEVLEQARAEIRRSWREVCELNKDHPKASELFNPERLPGLHDPFAGGGAIPLEAQRLGLETYASDLNPVAVLINKAMIEIPPKFAGGPPVSLTHSRHGSKKGELDLGREWPGVTGLAEDVRFYGEWMREEAQRRIGHFYPPVVISADMAKEMPDLKPLIGQKLTVIAWIWARTVKSPNPAFSGCDVPLLKSFRLSAKDGKQVWLEPATDLNSKRIRFNINTGSGKPLGDGTVGKTSANCLFSGSSIPLKYIREQGKRGLLSQQLVAIVAEGKGKRVYLPATIEQEALALSACANDIPTAAIEHWSGCTNAVVYGLDAFEKLFSPRQTLGLVTFSEINRELTSRIRNDAVNAGYLDDQIGIDSGGIGATAYAQAVVTYLSFAIDKMADLGNNLCAWEPLAQCPRHLFGKQAIPMVWDYAESNPLSNSSGSWSVIINGIYKTIAKSFEKVSKEATGFSAQADARKQTISRNRVISSDPPYYDNIPYSNLSDFFYIWLRLNLRSIYPSLFSTLVVPRAEELVATASRHGGKPEAEKYFLNGMTETMRNLSESAHPGFPVTIYYAFKQAETSKSGTTSSGWETFLGAVFTANFTIVGTWPVRTENASRMRGQGSNALASSIVLVCRKRPADAPSISRREFIRELNTVLPEALDEMTKGSGDERSPVAPVDLSQAIIGPGMAIFSKYAAVLEADGSPMSVRTALQLINRFLAEDDFDADTQFCLSWFEQNGWKDGPYGDAETLATGKGTSVGGVKDAGVIQSGGGKVRLLKWSEYPADWNPLTDNRTPIWEALHHLIRALKRDGGEAASGALLATLGGKAEAVRQLAYRLYTLCERLGQAEDARAYNELITSWTGIETAAAASKQASPRLPGFENT
jgi:putative DNA methylase